MMYARMLIDKPCDNKYIIAFIFLQRQYFFPKWHYLLLNFKKIQMIAGDIISEIIKISPNRK